MTLLCWLGAHLHCLIWMCAEDVICACWHILTGLLLISSNCILFTYSTDLALCALTLLVEHLACENWVIRCWYGRLSGAEVQMMSCKWCYCHPVISCFVKIQIGLTFLVLVYLGCSKRVSVCLAVYSTDIPSSHYCCHKPWQCFIQWIFWRIYTLKNCSKVKR